MQHVAMYCRVSQTEREQDVRSQLPDLERWAAAQDQPVRWYKDQFTGKTMDRPGWIGCNLQSTAGKCPPLSVGVSTVWAGRPRG